MANDTERTDRNRAQGGKTSGASFKLAFANRSCRDIGCDMDQRKPWLGSWYNRQRDYSDLRILYRTVVLPFFKEEISRMMRIVWTSALVTGLFCAGFAAIVDQITDQLSVGQVIGLAALSGTLGSVFAQLVLGGAKK